MSEQPDDAVHLDDEAVPRRADHTAFVEVDGEAVLYHGETGELHLLDPIATIVWGCFDGTAPLGTLATELAEAFGADRDVVLGDITALAERLAGDGLVEVGRG